MHSNTHQTGRILAGHCCIGTQRLKQRTAKISEPFMFNVFKMCKENHLRFLMNFTEALQNEQHIQEGFGSSGEIRALLSAQCVYRYIHPAIKVLEKQSHEILI